MSKKKKDIPPAKEHFVVVRMTDDMWTVLEKNAALAGISPSGYIRQLITNQKIILKPEVVFESWELLDVFCKDWRQSQPDCKASKRRRNIYGRDGCRGLRMYYRASPDER